MLEKNLLLQEGETPDLLVIKVIGVIGVIEVIEILPILPEDLVGLIVEGEFARIRGASLEQLEVDITAHILATRKTDGM